MEESEGIEAKQWKELQEYAEEATCDTWLWESYEREVREEGDIFSVSEYAWNEDDFTLSSGLVTATFESGTTNIENVEYDSGFLPNVDIFREPVPEAAVDKVASDIEYMKPDRLLAHLKQEGIAVQDICDERIKNAALECLEGVEADEYPAVEETGDG